MTRPLVTHQTHPDWVVPTITRARQVPDVPARMPVRVQADYGVAADVPLTTGAIEMPLPAFADVPLTEAVGGPLVAPATDVALPERYRAVRARTERLCDPLAIEDYVVTAMADASPAKWHLAHSTWFFETFVLARFAPDFRPYDPAFAFLFNSYYVQAGERHCRAQRGLVTRPTVAEVYAYRHAVDAAMHAILAGAPDDGELATLVTVGLHHEQQHQELLLTDLKYLFFANPIRPAYDRHPVVGAVPTLGAPFASRSDAIEWRTLAGGVAKVGHAGARFAFDNETPRHPQYIAPARVATRPVTNEEYARFIEDGGYRRPELWLSAGWATAQERGWTAPLYWERRDGTALGWHAFTLAGMQPLEPHDPVCHVSYYEADAYARWAATDEVPGARLPTEFEWELAAPAPMSGAFANGPHSPNGPDGAEGWYGAVWQWTQSPYVAYPGYRPAPGALGEYNGKFMADQWVLRGSSMATAAGHARRTYRNFFPADARWQFAGIRLATDAA